MSNNVCLVTLMHDPRGVFVPFVRAASAELQAIYTDICVLATPQTARETIAVWREQGALVALDAVAQIGESRRRCLQWGLTNSDAPVFHYCDCDRILHWHKQYPAELGRVVGELEKTAGYVAIGRTPRAFTTHPTVQIEAETITNQAFGYIFNGCDEALDVTAGSNATSRQAAETILQHSIAERGATDCEWPMIVQRQAKLPVDFVQVEGLEWETPTFDPDVWSKVDSAENWRSRISLAHVSIAAAIRVASLTAI